MQDGKGRMTLKGYFPFEGCCATFRCREGPTSGLQFCSLNVPLGLQLLSSRDVGRYRLCWVLKCRFVFKPPVPHTVMGDTLTPPTGGGCGSTRRHCVQRLGGG
jgi:hypothetical protein